MRQPSLLTMNVILAALHVKVFTSFRSNLDAMAREESLARSQQRLL
jgi:hypothetical protein